VRGFEYYTGLCFQLLSGGRKIGGGGRYDDLIPLLGGERVPACGFAFYLDSVVDILSGEVAGRTEKVVTIKSNRVEVEMEQTCFVLARALREAGYAVELEFGESEKAPEYSGGAAISVDDPSLFTVMAGPKSKRQEVSSVEGVLALLGEQA
jgi:histidyl-tRNA synthetase